MKRTCALSCLAAGLLLFCPAGALASLLITEFVPDNARTLADEDDDFPDWVEVHNPTAAPVDLLGWSLTDDPAALLKWRFPSVSLPAGGYLVVFASGKDRTNNPARLHTSFRLEASGGYLALVMPDGTNIASAYSYPKVKEDSAFGLAQSQITTSLLTGSVPQILVPTNAADLPADWNQLAYVPDGRWSNGIAPPAVGFDTNQVSGLPSNVAPSGTAAQSTTSGGFTPNLALNGNLGDFTHTLGADNTPFWQVTLTNQMAIFSVVLHNRTSCCGSRLRDITVEILGTNAGVQVTNYASVLLNPENAGFAFPNGPAAITNDLVTLTGGPVSGNIVRVRRTPDPDLSGTGGQGNTDESNVVSLAEVVVNAAAAAGLQPYFTTDIQSLIWNQNASAFVRLPFANSDAVDQLTLRARYDDGMVVHLNGTEVAQRNAPVAPQWDSAATADRNLLAASTQETLDLSPGIPNLLPGANVLAVQLLNASAASPDALLQLELTATRVETTPNVFFSETTPGSANTTEWHFDEVADTKFTVDRGFFEAPFSLSITSATPGAVIYYSVNGDEPGPGKGFLYTGPIPITNTTVLRTRAFKTNWKETDVDTASYIFFGDVIYQAANWEQTRIPPTNFPASWGANSVDYGMDPQVVTNYTLAQWKEALTQIPSMSIVTEMRNLFDATTGIYANASGHGEDWERPMSLELLDPAETVPGRFQENGGLRIRGGFSRNPQFFKHSFRLFFNRDYGAGSLQYPLFGDEGAQEFDKFDLRTSQNYSWPRNESPTFDTMVREVFCRQTLGDMGQPYRRSRYYHLYLNGQYWGLYETDERPSAYYGEAYFGGSKTNYDVVKCGNRSVTPNFATEATDGNFIAWSNLWTMCQSMRTNASTSNYFRPLGRNPDGTRNQNLEVLMDADNLIDYILGIFYSGDGDATLSQFLNNVQPNNWFGMRDRSNPEAGFRFFNSDCEHTLGSPSSQVNRTGPFGGPGVANEGMFMWSNPQWMHEELALNLEYRVRFGDHVQKHFFNGGALTLEANTNRFIAKAVQINKAIRAYSARWGDAIRTTQPYGESDWTNAIQFCLNWFTNRAGIVLGQISADGNFPAIGAPAFNNYGGFISPGFSLTMVQTNAGGTIYYTLDGTDPRKVGGDVAGGALPYGAPITLEENAAVLARVRVGTNWSPVIEAIFTTAQYFRNLAITEIHYHPPDTGGVDGNEFEFLELKNTGTNTLNLSGLAFTSGINFTFANGTRLAAGAFFVLARNPAAFATRYPGVAVNGVYPGSSLNNGGETLRLAHFIGGQVFAVTYDDASDWPQTPDGFGFSLVPAAGTNFNSDNPRHWRASANAGGSPGADDPAPTVAAVLINEVLTHTSTGSDFIELFNPTINPVTVGGWYLTDDAALPRKFRIPDGVMISGGGYRAFTEADFNPPAAPTSFTLSAEGEQVFLFSGDSTTNLTGYSHGFSFGAAAEGVTFGRHVISTGEEQFPAQLMPTPGAANAGPLIADVVIQEIHYNPEPGGDAFVEIRNRSGGDAPLFDPLRPTNTWRLNGVDFVFPEGVVLPAGKLALIVETDPALFRAAHSVPMDVPIFGPYGGALQNSGELLELQKLDHRGADNLAWVTLDAVRYNDRPPWPTAADGAGASLQRIVAGDYGNEPLNWLAASPTPGGGFPGGTAPVIDTQPASQFAVAFLSATFTVGASGSGLSYQWRFNGNNLAGATNPILTLNNLQATNAGRYSVVVFNAAGSAESSNAVLTVGIPARILNAPQPVSVRVRPDPTAAPMTNATFLVNASSSSPIAYQWRFNGSNLLDDATGPSLTISNVTLAHDGMYSCVLTDSVGPVETVPVRLTALIGTTIVQGGFVSHTVLTGAPVVFGVVASGNPLPFAYEWRFGSSPIVTNTVMSTQDFLVVTAPVTLVTNQLYRLIVKNAATTGNTTATTNLISTYIDADADGMADAWETAHGFNPGILADRNDDPDMDGMKNWEEFVAGTNPTNATSRLRVDLAVDGVPTVTFPAVSNKNYTVEYTDALPGGGWLKLAHILGRRTNSVGTVPDPAWTTNRFYRIATPLTLP